MDCCQRAGLPIRKSQSPLRWRWRLQWNCWSVVRTRGKCQIRRTENSQLQTLPGTERRVGGLGTGTGTARAGASAVRQQRRLRSIPTTYPQTRPPYTRSSCSCCKWWRTRIACWSGCNASWNNCCASATDRSGSALMRTSCFCTPLRS